MWAMAAIYFAFGLLALPHFDTMVHRYGFHLTLVVGIIGQFFLQLLVVGGCLASGSFEVSYSRSLSKNLQLVARWMLGIGSILTGEGHLVNTKGLVHMFPVWMPFGPSIWIVISGIGFIPAGLAILTRHHGSLGCPSSRSYALPF